MWPSPSVVPGHVGLIHFSCVGRWKYCRWIIQRVDDRRANTSLLLHKQILTRSERTKETSPAPRDGSEDQSMSAAPCDRKTWNKDKELWKDCSSEVVLTLRLLWFIVLFIHIAGFPVCCLTHNSSLLQDERGRDCKLRTPFNATL